MAGCFGSHPVDRYLESQLMRYLDDEADFESLVETLTANLSDEMYDKYENVIFKLIDKYFIARIERGRMSVEDAKSMMTRIIMKIEEKS